MKRWYVATTYSGFENSVKQDLERRMESMNMTDLVTPLTSLYDESMVNKRFRMTSGEWDYEKNRLLIQIQEDV